MGGLTITISADDDWTPSTSFDPVACQYEGGPEYTNADVEAFLRSFALAEVEELIEHYSQLPSNEPATAPVTDHEPKEG